MLQIFFMTITPSRLISYVKLLLLQNFHLNTTNCNGKNLYAAFWQIYAANMQHYAAKIFLKYAPLLDLFATWNCPNTQIFSLIQLIVKAKTFMQHFPSFMQQICCIMLQFFVFEMSTPFRLVCLVKLPLFLNFYLNTTNCKGKYLYAAFW